MDFSTEAVLGTPLQIKEDGNQMVVEIRNSRGNKVELKRFDVGHNR